MTSFRFRRKPCGPQRQLGVGLVELMISMVIGLVLVALVTSYYLSSRQSYQTTIVTSALTDGQRYAVQLLRRQLLLTGYSDSWQSRENNFPDRSDGIVPDFDDGQILASESAGEIWLRMQGAALDGQPIVSCSNEKIDVAEKDEEPIVAIVHLYVDDNATLMCETRIDGDTNTTPLLNGVEAIAFSYLDDPSDGFKSDSEDVEWAFVRAVQVDLLIRSEMETYDAPFEQSFEWPGGNKTFNDRHMRSRITRTIALRNAGGG